MNKKKRNLGNIIGDKVFAVLNFIVGTPSDSRKRKRARYITLFCIYLLLNILLGKNITSRHYPWYANVSVFLLLNINILLVIVLFVVLFRNLAKLMADRRSKIFGSRLQTKLTIFSAILVVVPVFTTYLMSTQFIQKSIDRWYDNNVRQIANLASNMAENFRKFQLDNLKATATLIANSHDFVGAVSAGQYYIDEYLINGVVFYDVSGPAYARQNVQGALFDFIRNDMINNVLAGNVLSDFVIGSRQRPYYWVGVPIKDRNENILGALFAVNLFPEQLAGNMQDTAELYYLFRQLRYFAPPVEKAFTLSHFLVAILVIFASIWSSMIFVRSLTAPLNKLAVASQKLSRGERGIRVRVRGNDEIALVAKSFNEMVEKLEQHTIKLQETNDELKGALNQISRDRQYIDTIYKNVDSALILFDRDLNLLKNNDWADNLILKDEAGGVRDMMLKFLKEFVSSDETERIVQSSLPLPNDEARHYTAHMTKIFDAGKELENVLLVLDDNTHVMNLQRIGLWKEVASRLAHEIKNPLTPIKLTAERVKRRSLEIMEAAPRELVDKSMDTIINETDDLLTLVEEFSIYSREPSFIRKEIKLEPVIDEVASLQVRLEPGVDIKINVGDELILGDRYQIKRMFVNLVQNAIHAGAKTILVTAERKGSKLHVVVEDNGSGIKEEDLSKIFIPYFSSRPSGTGLGLAIVQKIVEEHKGTITVESKLGEYTRFIMVFSTDNT